MSGMAGIFYRQGQPVDPVKLSAMIDILAHRGPDGAGIWYQGSVGLGHRMLHTTPESLLETLPLVNSGLELAITADARLDNRETLLHQLDIDDRSAVAVSDSQLLLAAYEKWGESCPQYLLGDFAFAIWDGYKQRLFCARDHFGVRPFYFHASHDLFAFASEVKALLAIEQVPEDLDEIQIGDFLLGLYESAERTFYQSIHRLPPGHAMTVSHAGIEQWCYWALDASEEIIFQSDDLYAETFRQLFEEAVRCRLRGHLSIGLLLSGGLDSSSLAVVAEKILAQNGQAPLYTFSGVFDELPECDERPYIRETVKGRNIKPEMISISTVGPLTDASRMIWHQDEPFYAPHMFMQWHILGQASSSDCRVMLDGHDGDTTVSHGYGLLPEQARNGQWLALAANLKPMTATEGERFWPTYLAYLWKLNLRPRLRQYRPIRKVQQMWRSTMRRAGAEQPTQRVLPPWAPPIAAEFAQRTDLYERYQVWDKRRPERAPTEKERHYRSVIDQRHVTGLEILNKVGAAFGREMRHPFWDRRLVEFCLRLPAEQKLGNGWGRLILRQAMDNELPAKVCWRRDKTNFLPSFNQALFGLQRRQLDALIEGSPGALEGYLNLPSLRAHYEHVKREPARAGGHEIFALWRAVSLALWLENRSKLSDYYCKPKEVIL